MSSVETTQTHRIPASRRETGVAIACGLGFVALGLLFAFGGLEGTRRYPAWQMELIGWLSLLFFGPLTLFILLSAATTPRVPLILAPEGLTDLRVSPDRIGWTEITSVRVVRSFGQQMAQLRLSPEAQARVRVRALARLVQTMNRGSHGDGLWINAQGVEISQAELAQLLRSYWQAHGAPHPTKGSGS